VIVCEPLLASLNTDKNLTLRVVDEPGDATTSVVAAAEMLVFERLGVTVEPLRSTHDA
jgi:hypothetical protein